MKLGEYLLTEKILSIEVLQEALDLQRYKKRPLGRILRDLGHLDQEKLNQVLTHFLRPECSLKAEELKAKFQIHRETPINNQKARRVVLIEKSPDELTFVSDSFRDEILEDLEKKSGKLCKLLTVKREILDYLLSSKESSPSHSHFFVMRDLTDDEKVSEKDPFAMLFRECLQEAVERGASDIHLEPKENGLLIRLRIHGDLVLWKTLQKDHQLSFSSKVKQIVNLDLSKAGEPIDSRASFKSFSVDVRANSVPLVYGDKIVLRLLNQGRSFDLEAMGMEARTLRALKEAASKKDGLILISGPTGSGKTTTLYSLLNSLDAKRLNISTIENPVEYRLSGINQIDIGASKSLTFSNSLRALMRQDPDVILVGEIRDEETADLCFQAAATGHLVLSTLHANGAFEVIERLLNLGIHSFSIKSNLRLSAAQRLVKKICSSCSIEVTRSELDIYTEHLADPAFLSSATFRKRNEEGCRHCEKGIVGRLPVLEFMEKDSIHQTLADSSNAPTLSMSLSKAALQLSSAGLVDLREVLEMT